jgi:hypothetical protein
MRWNSEQPDRRRIPLKYLAICVLLAAGLAAIDLSSINLNVGILYLLPALLAVKLRRQREFWVAVTCLIILVFLGYAVHRMQSPNPPGYRLANRFLAAVALLVAGLRLSAGIGGGNRSATSLGGEDGLAGGYDLALAGGLIICTFVANMITPSQFNLPILYAVPLTVAATLDRPKLVWIVFAATSACTIVGFWVTPPTVPQSLVQSLITNRFFAWVVQLAIALLSQRRFFCKHVWTLALESGSPGGGGNNNNGHDRQWVCSFCGQRITRPKDDLPVPVRAM